MRKAVIIARFLATTGIRPILSRLTSWSGVLCLNYHRIGIANRSVFDWGLWSASADDFDAQVRFLKSHFEIVTPDALPDILSRKKGRYVLLTFDDGYLDNYEVAFPILKSHHVPATFFVTTGFLDHRGLAWWDEIAWMVRTSTRSSVQVHPWMSTPVVFDEPDRERAVWTLLRVYKTMPSDSNERYLQLLAEATGTGRWRPSNSQSTWMTWDMVREMRKAGMSIGGHTVTHSILAQMSPEQQWQEISGCGERFRSELDEPTLAFSYPVGGLGAFNNDTRACLEKAGVRYAFSYYGGFRRFEEWDNYDIRRIAVESYIETDWFRALVALPQFFGGVRG